MLVPIAACCAALLLSACESMLPPRRASLEVEVPAVFSGSARAGVDAPAMAMDEWWQRFDDPLLAVLVQRAMRANTSVMTAQATLAQTRALRDVAAGALWPSLAGNASAQRGTVGGDSTGTTLQAGVTAAFVPDVFGANRSALAATESTAAASASSLADLQVLIASQVGLAYVAVRGGQARRAIAGNNLDSQLETLQITRWRQQAGLATFLEVEQARTSAEQTRALLPALDILIGQSRHALAVLSGQPAAALDALLAAVQPVPQPREDLLPGIPAETLRQRADVRAAEQQVSAALSRLRQADAARAPGFSLGGSFGLNALGAGAFGSGASVVSSLLASAAVPVFNGGSLRAQVRVQQAVLEQARVAYVAVVLGAVRDVEDALVALDGDRARLLGLRSAAEAAANASLLARQRFSSGLVDFQVVLETQRTQLTAQDSVASAGTDVGNDQMRLFRALGGGWRSAPLPQGPALAVPATPEATR